MMNPEEDSELIGSEGHGRVPTSTGTLNMITVLTILCEALGRWIMENIWGKKYSVVFLMTLVYLVLTTGMMSLFYDQLKIKKETLPFYDVMYYRAELFLTVGFGDITPKTDLLLVLSSLILMVDFFVFLHLSNTLSKILKDPLRRFMAWGTTLMPRYVFAAVVFGLTIFLVTVAVYFLEAKERLTFWQSFYVSVNTITTTGLGDFSFTTAGGRLFFTVLLLPITIVLQTSFGRYY